MAQRTKRKKTSEPKDRNNAANSAAYLLEARHVGKRFAGVEALQDVSFALKRGEVHALLGDNGAGKSTLIKVLSGVYRPTSGCCLIDGKEVHLSSPREALDRGIATVYQDLAMIPLMSVARNFFMGREPGKFGLFAMNFACKTTMQELDKIGIVIRDPAQAVGTLSGGERQSVAIARAVYFGARALILDEPTSALGVAQTSVVLNSIARLRAKGLGIVLITHNVRHAYAVSDRFTVLMRGKTLGTWDKSEMSRDELEIKMAGGKEMISLEENLGKMSAHL